MIQQTSIDAYEEVKPELGDRQREVIKALDILQEGNNMMIAKQLDLPINSITPRVHELRRKDILEEAYRDKCPYTKRNTIFWKLKGGS